MDFWQWLTPVIIAVVAFLIAIPPLLHIWGKPNIKISFDTEKGYRLTCWIRNMPIKRVLASLNVVRTQVVISPMISITDNEGRLLHFEHYPENQSDDIRLVVAEVRQPPKGLVYLKDVIGNIIPAKLDPGSYDLEVELYAADGRKLKKQKAQLHINKAKPYIELVNQ